MWKKKVNIAAKLEDGKKVVRDINIKETLEVENRLLASSDFFDYLNILEVEYSTEIHKELIDYYKMNNIKLYGLPMSRYSLEALHNNLKKTRWRDVLQILIDAKLVTPKTWQDE